MLLYIHGFRTTPRSQTSQLLKKHYGEHLLLSDHPFAPDAAIDTIENLLKHHPVTGLIASSLGGYYATYLAEKYEMPAVLINPSTRPFITTRAYLGTNTTYDGETFEWQEHHLKELEKYAIENPHPERYYLCLQKGDAVLDYRIALTYFDGAKVCLEEGGGHHFEGLERHFESIDRFLHTT